MNTINPALYDQVTSVEVAAQLIRALHQRLQAVEALLSTLTEQDEEDTPTPKYDEMAQEAIDSWTRVAVKDTMG